MGQKNSCTYYVSARKDLLVILAQTSLFGEKRGSDKYPLITEKLRDYLLFRRAFSITSQGPLDSYNLQQIVNIRSVLNKGLTPVLKEAFPLTIPVDKPKLEIREIPHGDWIAGFTSVQCITFGTARPTGPKDQRAEGNFSVSVGKPRGSTQSVTVATVFVLTQHTRDKQIMKSLVKYFGLLRRGSIILEVLKMGEIINAVSY